MGPTAEQHTHPSLTWAAQMFAADGAWVSETVLVKARAWSTVWRLETTQGRHYLKACGPGFEAEASVLPRLARLDPTLLPKVRSVDATHSWLLLADAGDSLLSHLRQDREPALAMLRDALGRYAALQIATSTQTNLAACLPDGSLTVLPDRLAAVVANDQLLACGDATRQDRASFDLAVARCRALGQRLAAYGVPETVDHGDLHANNIMISDGSARIIDWGDALFGHPFATCAITLDTTREWLGGLSAREETYLRQAYLTPWGVATRPELASALDLAIELRPISGALVWSRGFAAMTVADQRQAAGWVVTWLRRFAAAKGP